MASLLEGYELGHVHPDHPADVVIERVVAGGGGLPVVSRTDAREVRGVVTLDSVARIMRRRLPA